MGALVPPRPFFAGAMAFLFNKPFPPPRARHCVSGQCSFAPFLAPGGCQVMVSFCSPCCPLYCRGMVFPDAKSPLCLRGFLASLKFLVILYFLRRALLFFFFALAGHGSPAPKVFPWLLFPPVSIQWKRRPFLDSLFFLIPKTVYVTLPGPPFSPFAVSGLVDQYSPFPPISDELFFTGSFSSQGFLFFFPLFSVLGPG